jgi:hypothetical protein
LCQQKLRVGAHCRHFLTVAWWEEVHGDVHLLQQIAKLVFHHIGQCTHYHQLWFGLRRHLRIHAWQARHHCRQASVFALRKRGFNAAARVVKHSHSRVMNLIQTLRCARQIQLDHLRGARAHQEQHANVGAAVQQLVHHAIEFVMHIGQASQITLVDDGGAETRLGKNHHTSCRLNQVRAGA